MKITITPIRRIFLISVTLAFAGCAIATKQPSLFDTNPTLLTKQYTSDQIKGIEHGFKANPLQYSQELGNLLLWRMHQKSPEFALEFAQTPELNNGINAKEAKAMISIYNLIKNLDIPPNLFVQKNQDEHNKIILGWHGINEKKTNWDGFFYQSPQGKILDAKPIGFEQGEDSIDYERLKKGELKWKSISTLNDKDGILIALRYPTGNKIVFDINYMILSFKERDILIKNSLVFDEKDGLEGTLTIRNASETNLSPKLYALRDMVLSRENDYRYSAPLQVLLWGYMGGKFKEGDNPLKNYQDALEFVKPIWGEMEGSKWDEFDKVTSRLNLPELLHYYIKNNFSYERYKSNTGSASLAFKKKGGNCVEIEAFQRYCLNKAGFKAYLLKVISRVAKWHAVTKFYDRGKMYIIDDGLSRPKGILGPLKSIGDAGYKQYYSY